MQINNTTLSSIRSHCNQINYLVKLTLYIFLFLSLISIIYTIFMLIGFGNSLEVLSFKNEFVIKASNFSFWIDGSISKSLATYPSDQPFSNIKLAFVITQIIFFIKRSLFILIFYFTSKILNNIEKIYTPFIFENADKIKLVGLLIIAYSIVPNLISYSLLHMVTKGISLDIDSSIPIFFAASFILLLAKIFSYGCELQKDFDETL